MRRAIPAVLLGAVLAIGVAGGFVAAAQDTGVQGQLMRLSSTSPAEKTQFVADSLEEMEAGIKSATDLLEKARKDGDAEGVKCILDRLTSLRSLLDISVLAQGDMQLAMDESNPTLADFHFRKIAVARFKSRSLLLEIERCTSHGPTRDGENDVAWNGEEGEGDDFVDNFDDFDIDINESIPPPTPFF